MMKKLLFTIIACTLAFASCEKGDEPPKEEEQKKEDENPGPDFGSGDYVVPIGKSFSGATSVDFGNENAVVDFFAGEHDMAIYSTPTGKDNEIGKGKLIISREGNVFGMKLVAASGNTLAEAKLDLTNNDDYNYESLSKPVAGQYIVGASERLNGERIQIDGHVRDNGELWGQIWKEGVLLYRFRNNVAHFGKVPPAAIAALAGEWEGPHMQPLCSPNIVTVSVANDGTITLKGKTALSCAVVEVIGKWDGQDDYVRPNTEGWKPTNVGSIINIDASKGGGSQGDGGLFILVSELKDPKGILEVQSYGAGAAGNILVEKPTKK